LKPERLPALTSIRFFAALHVVLFHTAGPYSAEWPLFVQQFIGSGYVAVSIFFVLSGFVLTHGYTNADGLRVSNRQFYWARFVRLYPIYLVGLALMLPSFLERPLTSSTTGLPLEPFWVLASQLTFTQAWHPATALTMNFPGWSLSVEAFFSLCFPLLAAWLIRTTRGWTVSRLWLLLGVVWLIGLIPPLLYGLINPDGLSSVRSSTFTTWVFLVRYFPINHLPEFVAGMVLCQIWRGMPRAFTPRVGWLAEAALLVIFLVCLLEPTMPQLILHNGLFAPVVSLMILGLVTQQGLLKRLLELPVLVLLGPSSYALYVLHVPLSSWIGRSIWFQVLDGFRFYTIYLGLSLALAALVTFGFERFIKYKY
jgi:peptidoglycan/LPS O-acetylase OafA/YrhL